MNKEIIQIIYNINGNIYRVFKTENEFKIQLKGWFFFWTLTKTYIVEGWDKEEREYVDYSFESIEKAYDFLRKYDNGDFREEVYAPGL